jgi:hypothetical protein
MENEQQVYDKFQIRLFLTDEFAQAVRETPYDKKNQPILDALKPHNATLSCQFDEFTRYVAASDAHGDGDTTLANWTRSVLADPKKESYFKKIFIVAVKGEQLFDGATADALEADFAPLKGQGIVTKISRVSNDPARNPQPPARFRP